MLSWSKSSLRAPLHIWADMPPPGLASDHSRELGRDARPGAGTKQPSFQLQTLPGVWLSLKAVSGGLKPCSQDPGPHNPNQGNNKETQFQVCKPHRVCPWPSTGKFLPPVSARASWGRKLQLKMKSQTSIVTLLIIKKNWKSAKCSQIGELINKIWYIHMIKHIRR